MSREVDDKIVNMQFNNKEFEAHAKTSMSTLDKLKEKLQFKNASNGIKKLQSDAKSFTLAPINNAIGTVEARISTLQLVWANSLSNMINKAVNAGAQMSKALTTDQIKTGFKEYEQLVNATQTIWANTKDKGTNLDEINKALDELNRYADQTIYNFTQMTNNIGRFTAAGVDLNTSVIAIKGISNLAAVSGASAEDASRAMYQLSQAMASGTIKLMDWNSVVNANMGGQGFQNKLIETAREMGKAVDNAIEKQGSFRESLAEGWLTTDVLVKTLEKYTDTTTEFGRTATDAATKVKTFTQMWDVLKESVQSGWSESFRTIVGDFEEARTVLTKLTNAITNFIQPVSTARNEMLKMWAGIGKVSDVADGAKKGLKAVNEQLDGTAKIVDEETGWTGREMLILGLGLALQKVANGIVAVKKAFSSMFPPITAKSLIDASKRFMQFMSIEHHTSKQGEQLKTVIKGIGAALHIGVQIIDAAIYAIKQIWKVTSPIRQILLNIAEQIANFLITLDKFLSKTQMFKKVVNLIISILMLLPTAIKTLIKDFEDFVGIDFSKVFNGVVNSVLQFVYNVVVALNSFQKAPTKGVDAFIETIKEKFKPFTFLANAFKGIVGIFKTAGKTIGAIAVTFIETIKNAVGNMDNPLKSIFSLKNGVDVSKIVMNSSVVVLMVSLIKTVKELRKKLQIFGELGKSIKQLISGITGVFVEVQNSLKANVLIKIAVAIGVITASMLILASIREDKLVNSMVALVEIVTSLVLAIKVINGVDAAGVGGVLIGLTTTLLAVMTNVVAFSFLNPSNMKTAVDYVAALLTMLALFVRVVGAGADKNLAGVSPTLLSVAVSFQMIASSMLALGAIASVMSPSQLKISAALVIGIFSGLTLLLITFGALQNIMNKSVLTDKSVWKGLSGTLISIGLAFQIIGTALIGVMAAFVATAAIFDNIGKKGLDAAIKSFKVIVKTVAGLLVAVGTSAAILKIAGVKNSTLLALATTFTVVVALLNTLIPLFTIASLMKTTKLVALGTTLVLLTIAISGLTIALAKFAPVFKTLMILLAINTVSVALIISSVANLVSALVSLASIDTKNIKNNLAEIGTAVYESRQQISLGISGLIEALVNGIRRSTASICDAILDVINTVINFVQTTAGSKLELLLGVITSVVTALVNKLAEGILPLMDAAVKLITAIILGLTQGMQNYHDEIVEAISGFILELASLFFDVVDVMVDTGKGVISNFVAGILEQIGIDNDPTVKAVSDFVGRVLMPFSGVKDFLTGKTSGVDGILAAALNVGTTVGTITGGVALKNVLKNKSATKAVEKALSKYGIEKVTKDTAKKEVEKKIVQKGAEEAADKATKKALAKAGLEAISEVVAPFEAIIAGEKLVNELITKPTDKYFSKLEKERSSTSAGSIGSKNYTSQDLYNLVEKEDWATLFDMYYSIGSKDNRSKTEDQLLDNISKILDSTGFIYDKADEISKKDKEYYTKQLSNYEKDGGIYLTVQEKKAVLGISDKLDDFNKSDYVTDRYGGFIKKSDIDRAIELDQVSKGKTYLNMIDSFAESNQEYVEKLEEFTDLSTKDINAAVQRKEELTGQKNSTTEYSTDWLLNKTKTLFSGNSDIKDSIKKADIKSLIDSIEDTSSLDDFKKSYDKDVATEMYNKIWGDGGLPTGDGSILTGDGISQITDLDTMRNDVSDISDGMLSLNDSVDNTITPWIQGDISEPTYNDTAVIGAIDALAGDIEALNAAIFGMNVVLDSGALVGSLSGDIDSALATRYKYARRGV